MSVFEEAELALVEKGIIVFLPRETRNYREIVFQYLYDYYMLVYVRRCITLCCPLGKS